MPYSYKSGKKEVNDFIRKSCSPNSRVLDIGPGSGTYHSLLGDHFQSMDACEIYAPYIKRFKLAEKYKNVYNKSVTDIENFDDYDLVIFGDILEHLTVEDTQRVLEKAKNVKQLLIAVPFEYEQDASHGNEAERHIQDDLTHDNFMQRYPGFEPLHLVNRKGALRYGYYVRQGTVK
jgi:hypothetical protein